MSSYNLKIGSTVTGDMTPEQMVKVVVDVSLPPLSEENDDKINVSVLDGVDKICLPEKKIANLFGQFLSKSAIDDEIKKELEGLEWIKQTKSKMYGSSIFPGPGGPGKSPTHL